MNIDRAINKIFLWKKPSDFYTFDELCDICKRFYSDTCKIIFSDEYKILYQFSFSLLKDENDQNQIYVGYNGVFCFYPPDMDQTIIFNINNKAQDTKNIRIYTKENFNNMLHDIIQETDNYDSFNIYRFCLLSELYTYLQDSID